MIKLIKNIISWITTIILCICASALLSNLILGVQFKAVLTASMEPELPVGSLVIVAPAKMDNIKIGDDITYSLSSSDSFVTHRVIEIDRASKSFITKGVNNESPDGPVSFDNVLGTVKFSIPKLGLALSWLSSSTNKILFITAIIVIFLLSKLLDLDSGSKKRKITARNNISPEPIQRVQ